MMKSGFYYTNPERKNPIKNLNLLFKYNFTHKMAKKYHKLSAVDNLEQILFEDTK